MDDKATEYINLYNEIDNNLAKVLGTKQSNNYEGYIKKLENVINTKCSQASIIRNHKNTFEHFGYIRNELIHKYPDKITLTDYAIRQIRNFKDILFNPLKASDFFIRDVYVCQVNDMLVDVVTMMKKQVYTHVPVYDNEKFIGVLSESTFTYGIIDHLDENGDLLMSNLLVGDVLGDNPNDDYRFIASKTSIYDIKEMFQIAIGESKRLGALFITNLGKKDEKILGIITSWDLPMIEKYIQEINDK